MKAYLLTSGTIFAVFAIAHAFVTYEHWRSPEADLWFVLLPALAGALGAVLAAWAFRLTYGSTAGRAEGR